MNDQELFTLVLVSVMAVVLLAIGVIVLYNVFQNRILTDAEEAHQKELDYKNQLISNTIEVQERERSRIAKDLHDDIGTKLSIVNLNLHLLKSKVTAEPDLAPIMEQIEQSLTEGIVRARDISHDLYPPILEKFGVRSALESLANQVNRTGQLSVRTHLNQQWKDFTKREELHIYRVVQELLNNTIKHAEATTVTITSLHSGGKLLIQYADDGKGTDTAGSEGKGLGLSSILTRVTLLGGTLAVESERDKGYKVNILV